MKFSTRQDVDLTAADLFAAVSDFPRIERILMRRRTEVRRADPAQDCGAGMAWDLAFKLRGKQRSLRLQVIQFDRPERVVFAGRSEPFDPTIDLRVIALSRTRSRLICELELKPRNLRARLMLQTAKLGKAQLDRKFAGQIGDLVRDLTAHAGPGQGGNGKQMRGPSGVYWIAPGELLRQAAGR